MHYKKIVVELLVDIDEADVVASQLIETLDQLEEKHAIFGGDIETVAFSHCSKQRRSALGHTLAAAGTVTHALRSTRKHLGNAARAVV